MNIRRNASNIALWCHLVLAAFAAFALVMLTLALLGVSPEGLGMGLFLMLYFLVFPGLLLVLITVVLTLISPSKNIFPATLLLLLVGVTTELEDATYLSLLLILVYIASVAWAWITREHSSTEAE